MASVGQSKSGVRCSDCVVSAYNKFKLGHNMRYMIMHIDDAGIINILEEKEKDSNKDQLDEFNEMLGKLPHDWDRYLLVDLDCPQKNGSVSPKMFLISWCPDTASPKAHILYNTSKGALKPLEPGTIGVQANDLSDLNYEELLKRGGKM